MHRYSTFLRVLGLAQSMGPKPHGVYDRDGNSSGGPQADAGSEQLRYKAETQPDQIGCGHSSGPLYLGQLRVDRDNTVPRFRIVGSPNPDVTTSTFKLERVN
jgi:hypothetical protein